ncbi:protein kinase [Nocardia sp. NPDC050799]|uniref:protein kinase domain-containing protein n=1 Tax=Nocardia sp. NPDC050799 TaxID=3154842 RepID=UPI0033E5D12A
MGEIDLFSTQRHVVAEVTAELAEAGFSDAHEIGRGGFGVVYRCTQAGLDRIVAVKILTAGLDQENRERFVREQRAMAQLTGHPNIVEVLQVGTTASGFPYLVMPYYPQGSVHGRIRSGGPLSMEETLRLGIKIAGAIETAHRLGILHRDIKPGNILITDYGEPALTDFGIARLAGSFRTAAGAVAGSPAFTAPEVLAGEEATPAGDVYGLGATLFAVLTGHAAFERHSGEQVVAQFLRITTQPVPNLRDDGVAEDLAQCVERAMARAPDQRPSAATLGGELQQLQTVYGWPVDEMALRVEVGTRPQGESPVPVIGPSTGRLRTRRPVASRSLGGAKGTLPLDLTSFVGRRTELTETKNLLRNSRLVTVTGIGGVGKTRLALRAASGVRQDFADGVWLVELGDLRDGVLVPAVIAAAVGLRPSGQPLLEVLVEYLASRQLLLVLDNCEHLVDDTAKTAEHLLLTCPDLRILATSREALSVAGEVVERVPSLSVPDQNRQPSLVAAPRYDALALFADRASAAVPGFALTEDNVTTVAEICRQLDGLPLLIELAAARLRALSPEQILQRLTDRFALLTSRDRSAPSRHRTVRWCVDWSYSLCNPAEQTIWAQASVFAGSFELDAAEQVFRSEPGTDDLLDILAGLVDKSILIREETDSVVRFRLLETMRDYGREKLREVGEYTELRCRHRDWCLRLAENAQANWIGPAQLGWIARLDREIPNLRAALDFCLADDGSESGAALSLASALRLFWVAHGQVDEARYWLGRALAHSSVDAPALRAKALHAACVSAEIQGDSTAAAALILEATALADRTEDPLVEAYAYLARGMHAIFGDEPQQAHTPLHAALERFEDQGEAYGQIIALLSLGLAHELQHDSAAALPYHERALAVIESHHDDVYRAAALWATALSAWRQGDLDRPSRLLRQALRLTRQLDDPLMAATIVETLAWVVRAGGDARKAAVFMGAAEKLTQATGSTAALLPKLRVDHEDCEQATRRTLGGKGYAAAYRKGHSMDFDAIADYVLEEHSQAAGTGSSSELTKREREVAQLVAKGLTNKAIAARLVISQRTAQGHVEHILTKLGFASRAQIAAWVVEQSPSPSS